MTMPLLPYLLQAYTNWLGACSAYIAQHNGGHDSCNLKSPAIGLFLPKDFRHHSETENLISLLQKELHIKISTYSNKYRCKCICQLLHVQGFDMYLPASTNLSSYTLTLSARRRVISLAYPVKLRDSVNLYIYCCS